MKKTTALKPLALALSSLISAAATAQVTLEEVVVTAQKRAESLQDVPISVSAMSGDKLQEAGIPSMQEFSAYVPNLNITTSVLGDVISVRGIQSGVLASIEQSVPTFVDSVYRGRGTQSRFSFLDVGTVEVLRGPQGTLFGKNTIGGALNITSAAPTEVFEGSISGQYDPEHEETEVQGYVSGALTDTLLARVALLQRETDKGWVENTYYGNDEPLNDEWAGRVSLEWDASDSVLVKFKYEQGEWENKGAPYEENIVGASLTGLYSAFGATFPNSPEMNPGNRKTSIGNSTDGIDYGAAQVFEGDTRESSLRVDYDVDNGTWTTIAGYSEYDYKRLTDADFNAFDSIGLAEEEDFDQTSLEVRFVSDFGDGFEMIAGAYWQDSSLYIGQGSSFNTEAQVLTASGTPTGRSATLGDILVAGGFPGIPNGGVPKFTRFGSLEQESETLATFAQGTYDLTDTVRVTVGARYAEEDKSGTQNMYCAEWATDVEKACAGYELLLAEFTPHSHDLQRDEEEWTYTLNAQWDATDNLMAYATLSTGVKSGGFNSWALTDIADEAEFEQEKVKSFEIGAKMTLADGAAELNVALFDMEYTDLQATVFTGSTGFVVENAASASIWGLEADGRWQLTENLMLRGSLGYVNFEFDEYSNAGCTDTQKVALGAGSAPSGVIANPTTGACQQDLKGGTSAFTPEWTASLSLEHEYYFSDYYLRSVVDANWLDDHHTAQDNDELAIQDAYTSVGLSLTLAPQDDQWDLALVGKNLLDEDIIAYSNDMTLMSGSQQVAWGKGSSVSIRGRWRF